MKQFAKLLDTQEYSSQATEIKIVIFLKDFIFAITICRSKIMKLFYSTIQLWKYILMPTRHFSSGVIFLFIVFLRLYG